jgi:hypothetical protein
MKERNSLGVRQLGEECQQKKSGRRGMYFGLCPNGKSERKRRTWAFARTFDQLHFLLRKLGLTHLLDRAKAWLAIACFYTPAGAMEFRTLRKIEAPHSRCVWEKTNK